MKYIYLFISILILSGFQGCENALDEKIYGQIPESEYWNTEQDAVKAIKAAYASARGGWQGLSFWQFVVEDMGTEIGAGGYFATLDYTAYTGWSGTTPDFVDWGIWGDFWKSINYANAVLDNVPGMDIDENVKNRILGEAHAIRAMVYFYLVNWFGGMPEVTTTKETPLEIPRQTVASNYTLIENDLKAAIEMLPLKAELISMNEADYGRLAKGAAQALLARAYLQQKKWQDCADAANNVIHSGEYSLEDNYLDIFTLENEGFNNKEEIWVLPFIAGTSPVVDADVLQVYLWRAPENTAYSKYYDWNGDIRVTLDFYDSFEKGDLRRNGLLASSDAVEDPVMLLKYPPDPATDGYNSGTDYPLIRLADVFLMHAEALANLNDLEGAVEEVNKVRARAGLNAINASNFNTNTLLTHIYNERKWELYFEGHAKRDKIRMDYDNMIAYIKSKSADWELYSAERYLLLPIPSNALASNPGLVQNPGF
jgi:starch-binding outer membrane protein, SusD/RagB family